MNNNYNNYYIERVLLMIGERIKALRKQAGLTQAELGKKIGISQTAVIAYEKNVSTPPPDRLLTMSKLFGVTSASK